MMPTRQPRTRRVVWTLEDSPQNLSSTQPGYGELPPFSDPPNTLPFSESPSASDSPRRLEETPATREIRNPFEDPQPVFPSSRMINNYTRERGDYLPETEIPDFSIHIPVNSPQPATPSPQVSVPSPPDFATPTPEPPKPAMQVRSGPTWMLRLAEEKVFGPLKNQPSPAARAPPQPGLSSIISSLTSYPHSNMMNPFPDFKVPKEAIYDPNSKGGKVPFVLVGPVGSKSPLSTPSNKMIDLSGSQAARVAKGFPQLHKETFMLAKTRVEPTRGGKNLADSTIGQSRVDSTLGLSQVYSTRSPSLLESKRSLAPSTPSKQKGPPPPKFWGTPPPRLTPQQEIQRRKELNLKKPKPLPSNRKLEKEIKAEQKHQKEKMGSLDNVDMGKVDHALTVSFGL